MKKVLIIGSGPAGLTAAIYASRAALDVTLLAGTAWGGQLMLTTEVENYPGFKDGILGPELMMAIRGQAERFGTKIIDEPAIKVDFSAPPFKVATDTQTHEGDAVIIATGADTMWLGVTGEERLIGRGVSSCAPCDAFFFKEKKVIVVGGGDSAMEEALVLSKFATEVTIVHRRDAFRASKIMQEKVKSNPKIKIIWNTELTDIVGENKVEGVKLNNTQTKMVSEMAIDGVFVAIGHTPNTEIFKGQIDLDDKGYIKVIDHTLTNVEGVFVAGDVHDHHYRQAVTAAAFGCMAAMDAEKWLEGRS